MNLTPPITNETRVKILGISRKDAWFDKRKHFIGQIGTITTEDILCNTVRGYHGCSIAFDEALPLRSSRTPYTFYAVKIIALEEIAQ